jgi:hypothetical protein
VIVFYQNHVEQTRPVVLSTAKPHGELVCRSQPRRGFTRIKNDGVCRRYGVNKFSRQGGNP